jgi:signal transduction histidine kinase
MTDSSGIAVAAKSGSAKMRPRARIISLIGEELISDEAVAVVELVKNAYDADASKVEIRFEGENILKPDTLVIADDGIGMTLKTILTGWFEPGTVTKRKNSISPGGRLYQGAKGVGRFAAARLAGALYLETKCEGMDDGVTVLLEWGRFDEDSYLDEVELQYEVRPIRDFDHGTKLQMMGLRKKKDWTEDDFREIHNRLSRLISPFGDVEDFSILLTIPGYPDLTGEVSPHALIQKPVYALDGTLEPDGHFTGKIKYNGKTIKQFRNHHLGKKGEVVGCGGFSVEFRAWDRDKLGLSPLMLKFDLELTELRNIITQYSGVSIYRDGFRVHPYGSQGNDWLQLDNRSRQSPTTRLANNQVVAAIRLSRESNPDLIDRTTREGLVHNTAYEQLKTWVGRVLALLEEERYRIRPREDTGVEEIHTLFEVFDLSPVVEQADKQLGRQHPVAKLVRKSDSDIREGVKRLQEHYSRLLMTAGIGQLVDLVIHEIGAPVGRANREIAHLEKVLFRLCEGDVPNDLKESITAIKGWLEQIVALRARLDPKTAGMRGRATTFSVQEEIIGNLLLFENLLAKQKIKPTTHTPHDPVIVKMPRSALGQVLANLLDNSIYWLTRHHGDGKGGKIDVTLNMLKHGFRIRFCDDGPGVHEADRERIFDPYFSRKENGMGLGLYVARQVTEPFGKLVFADDCRLSGACFEATFEKGVGL